MRTIQRTGYEVLIKQNDTRTEGQVMFNVNFKGQVQDRGDALLMILDAWDDAMKESGLDPVKGFEAFQREGSMH